MPKKPAKAADVKLAEPDVKAKKPKAEQKAAAPPKKRGRPTKAEKAAEEKRIQEARQRRELTTAEWRKIRMEYVRGKTTFAKLAEKYSLNAGYIRRRASKERWSEKRRNLDAKTEQKTIERVADARARELSKLMEIQDELDELLDLQVKAFAELKPRKFDDARGLESLTKAINTAVQTKRDLYNLPNETERAKIESLREKAKLDRQRYEDEKAEKARMASEAENTMIRVVIQGESEGPLDE